MTPLALPWAGFGCFGCSSENAAGLALSLQRLPDGRVAARTTLPERYASYPGIVHGGIISTLVDEVMGNLIAIDHGLLAFCATLRTRMLAPVRTGRPYLTAARLVGTSAGTGASAGTVRAEADVLDADGEVCVMASGTYQPISAADARALMGLGDAEYANVQHFFDHRIGTP